MKRTIFLSGLLALLCGCASNSTKIEIIKYTDNKDDVKIYTEVAEIGEKSDFAKNINAEISTDIEKTIGQFLEEADKSEISDDKLEINQTISFNENKIVSIIADCEKYTGGVHGELMREVKNLDLKNNRELAFTDIFCDEKYSDRINAYIDRLVTEKPNKYADLWKKPVVSEEQGFYLTQAGVVIYYPPYELSYYSRGFVEFEIPYEELSGYLNPEYAGRIY